MESARVREQGRGREGEGQNPQQEQGKGREGEGQNPRQAPTRGLNSNRKMVTGTKIKTQMLNPRGHLGVPPHKTGLIRGFITSRPASKKMLKGILQTKMKRH